MTPEEARELLENFLSAGETADAEEEREVAIEFFALLRRCKSRNEEERRQGNRAAELRDKQLLGTATPGELAERDEITDYFLDRAEEEVDANLAATGSPWLRGAAHE